ncbi:glycosyltransferase family 4 protein [Roseimicrobium sp. ORNL1]|uniref:glycosyltransferase family 4 protein n=1 Tax=Roseimicrobium sp. ORNL1 TaxID=2711231 RepID=UPI0013E15B77|nr:glycosyltransferase family 4 protein [Roseimicrobium sp. ORNL1]QIF02949.1 glycosyltransferase family 4 protein [Roseimicrobium sp. ORNL1]
MSTREKVDSIPLRQSKGRLALVDHAPMGDRGLYPYYVAHALAAQGWECSQIEARPSKAAEWFGRLAQRWMMRLEPHFYNPASNSIVIRSLAKRINKRIAGGGFDGVICTGNPVWMAGVEQPWTAWTDHVFAAVQDLYPINIHYQSPRNKRVCRRFERRGLSRAGMAAFTSDWAAEICRTNYPETAGKVKTVLFGPSMTSVPDRKELDEILAKKTATTCNLLFVGWSWERKGGDAAIEVTRRLRQSGVDAKLIILGPPQIPEYVANEPGVEILPTVNKNQAGVEKRLWEIYGQAHFLILPTTADCAPICFAEAACFGIPVVTTIVGGTRSLVSQNVNGACFAIESFVAEATTWVRELWGSPARYRTMVEQSRTEYELRMSWDSNIGPFIEAASPFWNCRKGTIR